MRFWVWGRNSIKNHSLTLLDTNLCIKPRLNSFSSPPRQVYLFKVTVYVYLWGSTKARICRTIWTDSKWRPVPWSVMVFLFQAWSKHTFVEPKIKGNMLQYTRMQRNGRLSPKSDDNMNDSCVKTQTPRLWTELKLTANCLTWNFVDFILSIHDHKNFEMCSVLNANHGLWGLSRLWERRSSWMEVEC